MESLSKVQHFGRYSHFIIVPLKTSNLTKKCARGIVFHSQSVKKIQSIIQLSTLNLLAWPASLRHFLGFNVHLGTQVSKHVTQRGFPMNCKELVLPLSPLSSTSLLVWLSAQAAKSPVFTNVQATPLSGKRFVGKMQGISHQITKQTASLLWGCEAVISEAEGGDLDKCLALLMWNTKPKLCI